MLSKNLISGKCYRDGVEITVEEYSAAFEEIKAKNDLANQLYSGEITNDDIPAEWQAEIQRQADKRLTEIDDDPELTAEEVLDIVLGGGSDA